jgi:hypothetical protein
LQNAGPHLHSLAFHHDVINATARWLEEHYHGRLVWRTSIRGHPWCEEYVGERGPEHNASKAWDYGPFGGYSWQDFGAYNQHAAARMQSLGGKGALVMHMDRMLAGRADGHVVDKDAKDCLHYFMPGPLDWWAVALYNHLEAEFLADRPGLEWTSVPVEQA